MITQKVNYCKFIIEQPKLSCLFIYYFLINLLNSTIYITNPFNKTQYLNNQLNVKINLNLLHENYAKPTSKNFSHKHKLSTPRKKIRKINRVTVTQFAHWSSANFKYNYRLLQTPVRYHRQKAPITFCTHLPFESLI